jgi:hypothetical protein
VRTAGNDFLRLVEQSLARHPDPERISVIHVKDHDSGEESTTIEIVERFTFTVTPRKEVLCRLKKDEAGVSSAAT